ncbi:pirin family protein [Candidatus Paracaedibacter symbiosus]|uniref:pirin family protein n=1 Tax=Candidatus Paracaedibacter symbiosus TaxID=244582 RepID=UPI000509997F|nr:pirin family protein [Candidatus Paracaedibacter symbiosus]
MVMLLRNSERGFRDHGWLKSYHSFSFGDYYNPTFTGFRNLRVINEDYISSKSGFPTHEHANMEILTYMLTGSLMHEDTLGHKKVIYGGDVQYMRAGHGMSHSEYNNSATETTHFLQIWLLPLKRDVLPTYDQINLERAIIDNKLKLIAAGLGDDWNRKAEGVIELNSDAKIYASILHPNYELTHTPMPHKSIWIQVITGKIIVNGLHLERGDAIAFDSGEQVSIHAVHDSHFLLFNLGSPGMV